MRRRKEAVGLLSLADCWCAETVRRHFASVGQRRLLRSKRPSRRGSSTIPPATQAASGLPAWPTAGGVGTTARRAPTERVPLNLIEVILAQGSTFWGRPALSPRAGIAAPNARRPAICMSCTWHIHHSRVCVVCVVSGFRSCRSRSWPAARPGRNRRHSKRHPPPLRPRAGT